MEDSWGAATMQSPLKINELNDGLKKWWWWWSGREGPRGWQKEAGWTRHKWQYREPLPFSLLPIPHHTPTAPPVASPSILLPSQEPEQIERQGDYEDVSWSEAGERGAALQMRSGGSWGGSLMDDRVCVSDRLWNGALLHGCAAPGPFICDWLVWSCVMVPSALCCFSFFTYKHRSQRLREDELCFVIFTYTLAQKSGQVGKL